MPELPDVEIFKRIVDRHCLGQIVVRVDVTDPDSVDNASSSSIERSLQGTRVRACFRYGKYLLIDCDRGGSLVMHFGTNGSLQFVASTQPDPPYGRLSLVFQNGDRLIYINPRRIGRVGLVEHAEAFLAEAGLGPDALDRSFDEAAFVALLAARKQPIKAVLMDQSRVAGIGNVYADEILFHARLHPRVIAATLDRNEIHRLFLAMHCVLQIAIERGAGAEGFTDRLPAGFLLPERHAGGRCPRCGAAIQSDKSGGRTGYFCPVCQP